MHHSPFPFLSNLSVSFTRLMVSCAARFADFTAFRLSAHQEIHSQQPPLQESQSQQHCYLKQDLQLLQDQPSLNLTTLLTLKQEAEKIKNNLIYK